VIQLTPAAISRVQKLLAERGTPGDGLRIAVRGGGCSGNSYVLEFCAAAAEDDQVLEFGGVRVFVDPRSAPLLTGTHVDFVSGLMESGFKFSNPNARHQCACGESFSA
jgi:iron-sulfur cluster assembly protein